MEYVIKNNSKLVIRESVFWLLGGIVTSIFIKENISFGIISLTVAVYLSGVNFLEKSFQKVEINKNFLTYFNQAIFRRSKYSVDLINIDRIIFYNKRLPSTTVHFGRYSWYPSYILILKRNQSIKDGLIIYLDYDGLIKLKHILIDEYPHIILKELGKSDIANGELSNIN